MKKIIFSFALLSFLSFAPQSFAASASIVINPVTCGHVAITGTASYTPPETLRISFDGAPISLITGGASTWSVNQLVNDGTHTVMAEVLDSLGSVIFTTTAATRGACGGTNPLTVMQVWGLDAAHTPTISAGESVTDKFGITYTDTCFKWEKGLTGCMNLTGTDYYIERTLSMGRELLASGYWVQFPQYSGLYAAIKAMK